MDGPYHCFLPAEHADLMGSFLHHTVLEVCVCVGLDCSLYIQFKATAVRTFDWFLRLLTSKLQIR